MNAQHPPLEPSQGRIPADVVLSPSKEGEETMLTITKAAEVEGALISGLEIDAFGLEEFEKAEAWLAT